MHFPDVTDVIRNDRLALLLSGLPNVLEVEPPLEAPDLCLVGHELAQAVPGLVTVDVH